MQVSDRAILPRGCEGDCRCSMNFMVSRVTASVNPRQEAGIGPHAKGRCRACRISGSTERYLIGVPGTFVSRLWGRIVSLVRGMSFPWTFGRLRSSVKVIYMWAGPAGSAAPVASS